MSETCTSLGCYLQEHGGLVSLPLVTVAGLVDGINPCAIGMMILLLGYLLIFARKPERIFKTGILYIGTVYLTYLLIGLFFYKSVHFLNLFWWRGLFNQVFGGLLVLAGLINIKDYFYYGRVREIRGIGGRFWDLHLEIPQKARPSLQKLVAQVSYPAAIILAILVTFLETPCSLPIYLGTANILAGSGLAFPLVLTYFFYYNFLFVLPLILILILIWKGREIVTLKEWEHKYKKWMKLAIGTLLLGMGFWLFLW